MTETKPSQTFSLTVNKRAGLAVESNSHRSIPGQLLCRWRANHATNGTFRTCDTHKCLPKSLNLVIDYFVQFGISFAVGIIAVVIGGEAGADLVDSTPSIFLGILILLGYYFFFEATTGRTLGKLVTGTKVVNEYGGKATLKQIAGRTFARHIPFEALSFLGTPTRGWHDSLSKTFVIKSR